MQDPKKRATANEILQHSWMRENGTASDRPLDNVIVKRMQGFLHMNKLKKEALKVMATGMSPEEIAGLRSLFQVRLAAHGFLWRGQGFLHMKPLKGESAEDHGDQGVYSTNKGANSKEDLQFYRAT